MRADSRQQSFHDSRDPTIGELEQVFVQRRGTAGIGGERRGEQRSRGSLGQRPRQLLDTVCGWRRTSPDGRWRGKSPALAGTKTPRSTSNATAPCGWRGSPGRRARPAHRGWRRRRRLPPSAGRRQRRRVGGEETRSAASCSRPDVHGVRQRRDAGARRERLPVEIIGTACSSASFYAATRVAIRARPTAGRAGRRRDCRSRPTAPPRPAAAVARRRHCRRSFEQR